MAVKFKYKKRTYIYDNGEVRTEKNNLARDQETLIKVAEHYIKSVAARGFHLSMNYNELEQYISTLDEVSKEELFHNIYEAYLYTSNVLSEEDHKLTQAEFYKCMAKVKRYEKYLYIILES